MVTIVKRAVQSMVYFSHTSHLDHKSALNCALLWTRISGQWDKAHCHYRAANNVRITIMLGSTKMPDWPAAPTPFLAKRASERWRGRAELREDRERVISGHVIIQFSVLEPLEDSCIHMGKYVCLFFFCFFFYVAHTSPFIFINICQLNPEL